MVKETWRHSASVDLWVDDIQQRLAVSNLPPTAQRLEAADPIPATVGRGHLRVPHLVQSTIGETDEALRNW